MHCSSCNEKGECWALCHQYSCTCITCIYILVLYLQNSSKASQAPSPWGGNGKWVFNCWVLLSGNKWFQEEGKWFCAAKGKEQVVGWVFWELQVYFKYVLGRNCSGLQNWSYRIDLALVGVRGSHWTKSHPPVSHPVWVGRKSWITPSSVQSPLKSKIRRGGSVLNSLTVCFSSQMKAIKISVN